VVSKEGDERHQNAGRAESTLQRVSFMKASLKRVEIPV
jgi:hypothetical protein